MAIKRYPFPIPPNGSPFLGENNRDGLTHKVYSHGFMRRLRNYHLGFDGITKRQGAQAYQATGAAPVQAGYAVQSLGVHETLGTRTLVAVAYGRLFANSGTGTWPWADITPDAFSFASAADTRLRYAMFYSGTTWYLIGTDGSSALFKWDGDSGNKAVALGGTPPSKARAIATFMGRLFALNTDAGPTILEYSDDGTIDAWASGQYLHCDRGSEGMALANHGRSVLLVFHRHSWHRLEFLYVDTGLADSYFVNYYGGEEGCISPDGVCHYQGVTYFASDDGIFRIVDPSRGAECISGAIDGVWKRLIGSRMANVQIFPRGRGFNEIVVLVSQTDTSHCDTALVYNPGLRAYHRDAGWTIFDSQSGSLDFSCGLAWQNDDGDGITLLGGYDGVVYEAWGNDEYNTGYTDIGQPIYSDIQTGFLDFGQPDMIKGLRSLQADMMAYGDRTFNFAAYGVNQTPAIIDSEVGVGASGAMFDDGVSTFDVSYFATDGLVDFEWDGIDSSGRLFQFQMTEHSEERPHAITGMRAMYALERRAFE